MCSWNPRGDWCATQPQSKGILTGLLVYPHTRYRCEKSGITLLDIEKEKTGTFPSVFSHNPTNPVQPFWSHHTGGFSPKFFSAKNSNSVKTNTLAFQTSSFVPFLLSVFYKSLHFGCVWNSFIRCLISSLVMVGDGDQWWGPEDGSSTNKSISFGQE